MGKLRHLLPLALLVGTCTAAIAHDTWFEARPAPRGDLVLALGTGVRFPAQETGIDDRHLARQGCRVLRRDVPMEVAGNLDRALLLRPPPAASSCWAELAPFEIELAPKTVEVYLREIRAPQGVRAAWAEMQQRGQPWRESYTKHARIAMAGGADRPTPMDMDILLESPARPIRPGDRLTFRVLRDGAPLPDFAVELLGDRVPVGIWRQTDAEGRMSVAAPAAGRWVLRGTDLRLSDDRPDRWESRFITLAFEVQGTVAQNGSSLNSNSRSASQMAASTAIANEPR